MSTPPLARLGIAVLAVVLATTGLSTPAHAAAETGTIQGQLTTNAGAEVADARVFVTSAETDDYLGDTTTEADGTFTLRDIPAGGVTVGFETQGLDQWATGKRSKDEATILTVRAGQTLTVIERLLPTGRITGRLTSAGGAPVQSGEVNAWSPDNEATVPYSYLDEDGRYSIEVAPGDYTVQFRLNNLEQWAYQARDQEGARTFTVAEGQTVVVDDTLLATGGVTGRLVDSAGQPLGNASVSLHTGDTTAGTTTTDENGRYDFGAVLTGEYKVSFKLESGAVQWAYGKRTAAQAAVIVVRAGQDTRVDDTFGATGAVAGRFTDADGRGLADHIVHVTDDSDDEVPATYETTTDDEGRYRIGAVLSGRYLVSFVNQQTWRRQYAYGKGNAADADRITVTAGATTTVDDTRVAGARLRITASDARSGAAIRGFCAYVSGPAEESDCTTGTELVIGDLPAGPYEISLSPGEGGLYLDATARATVTAGQTRAVVVPMRLGGAVETTVTAADTGKPVADACLIVVRPGDGFSAESGTCTDGAGRARTWALEAGSYQVFVEPSSDSPYGAQWVGRAGGTGDQRAAARITVQPGKVAATPAVKLDRAGSISGTVSSAATGKPVGGGAVSYHAWDFGAGPSRVSSIDDAGRYTLTGLGPYKWPVLFTADGAPRQWSGGTGDRFRARQVKVNAGATTSYDIALKQGALLRGSVTHPGGTGRGRLTAYNAVTGDPIGVSDFDSGSYEMQVIGSQNVKIHYYVDAGNERYLAGWYDGVADRARAKQVSVPANGTKTLNISIR